MGLREELLQGEGGRFDPTLLLEAIEVGDVETLQVPVVGLSPLIMHRLRLTNHGCFRPSKREGT